MTATTLPLSPETTELERRVLAHERILQSLIAFMSRSDPRFIDHLRKRFVEPMSMARREHDYTDVDDYAEEFIRAIMRLGEILASRPLKETDSEASAHRHHHDDVSLVARPDRVQLHQRNGIWQMTIDGNFHGDYHRQENALAAAALARLSLQ